MMLQLALVLTLAIASTSTADFTNREDFKAQFTAAVDKCQGTIKISQENVDAFKKNKMLKDDSDEASKCFVACFMDEMSMKTFGVPSSQQMLDKHISNLKKINETILTPEELEEMKQRLDECMQIGGTTDCSTKYNRWNCIREFKEKA